MKTCTKCETTQPRDNFHNAKNRPDGKNPWCKLCVKGNNARWYQDNRVRLAEVSRQWREDNREQYLSTARDYHAARIGNRDPEKAWPDHCTYNAAHLRVKAVRGRAHTHSCIDCGGSAQEWSYRGGSDLELMEPRDLPRGRSSLVAYSPDPVDYDPRCKPCHVKFDSRERESA